MQKFLVAILFTYLIALGAVRADADKVRVVIVTVSSYENPDVLSLVPNGEQRDAEYMKIALSNVLKGKDVEWIELSTDEGVKSGRHATQVNIRKVKPERRATQANIRHVMERISAETRPGDGVIFYFSGHGSRKGDHFSLCPFDATQKSDDHDISDTELANWAKGFVGKTDNVTIILDCCFTEYPIRDIAHRAKVMVRDDNAPTGPLQSDFPLDHMVLIKASRTDEEAQQEDETGTGEWVGVFTHWLCYEMNMPNAAQFTYEQLMQRVNRDVKRDLKFTFRNSFSQTPQIEGVPEQQTRTLFQPPAATAQPLLPPHLNLNKVQGGKAELNGGDKQGVTGGSEYAIYPATNPDFNNPIGMLSVDQVGENSSSVTITNGNGVRDGDLAVEKVHKQPEAGNGLFAFRVVDNETNKGEIEAALLATKLVTISEEKPALVLKVETKDGKLNGKLFRVAGANDQGNTPVERTPVHEATVDSVANLVEQFRPWMENLNCLRGLTNMANPDPGINLVLAMNNTRFRTGDKTPLTITPVDRDGHLVDCYVTLIDIDAHGVPRVIFPRADSPQLEMRDNHLFAPRKLTLTMYPPVGQEILIGIATRQPSDWSKALTLSGPHVRSVEATAGEIQSRSLDDWGISIINFFIADK